MKHNNVSYIKLLLLLMFVSSVQASTFDLNTYSTSTEYAQVTHVVARQNADDSWCFSTSVRHNDQGWEHYADGWAVIYIPMTPQDAEFQLEVKTI